MRFDKLKITWKFEYRYNAKDPWRDAGKETTEHETYITYARSYEGFKPQNRPWIEVLRRACSYAHGADTLIKASSMVATGIYESLEFYYLGDKTHSIYDGPLNHWGIVLWLMLHEGWMDCRDSSNYWTIMMQWLGITNAKYRRITEAQGAFYFKTLRPISTSRDINEGWWVRDPKVGVSNFWIFHQVGVIIHDPDNPGDSHVYDPTIKLNRNAPRVPVNMIKEDYQRDLYDNEGTFEWGSIGLLTYVY